MMKLPNKLIAVDIETTDSNFSTGEIVQIGAILVNEDLSLGETFNTYLKPATDYRNAEAMGVNQISEEVLSRAPRQAEALKSFAEFSLKIGETPMLAAWGTHFDVVFIREAFKKNSLTYPFSYRCLDLKSIAVWELSKRGQYLSGGVTKFLEGLGLKYEGKEHDALDDIKNTMRIILALSENEK